VDDYDDTCNAPSAEPLEEFEDPRTGEPLYRRKATTTHETTVYVPDHMRRSVTVSLRVKVKGMWRVRLGLWLMKMGARMVGAKVTVTQEEHA
jgi:hypothetical protein